MTNTEITGCSDCPFSHYGLGLRYCCRDAASRRSPEEGAPDWCPLRQGPVTILLKSASCPECGVNGYQDGEKLHGIYGVYPTRVCSKLKG